MSRGRPVVSVDFELSRSTLNYVQQRVDYLAICVFSLGLDRNPLFHRSHNFILNLKTQATFLVNRLHKGMP